MTESEQWFSNKDLYEQINGMKTDFLVLQQELKQTREEIKKYNNLRKDLYETQMTVRQMQSVEEGKSILSTAIREWGGWIVAILALAANFINYF